jgi:hypothetical protein
MICTLNGYVLGCLWLRLGVGTATSWGAYGYVLGWVDGFNYTA